MRITAFLLLFSVIQVMGGNSYSQNTRLSLNLKDVSIENVLDEIENQSEFFFLFNQKLVNVDRKVDIDVKNKKIKDILTHLFTDEDVNCLVLNRQILLSPKYITETVNVTRDRQPQEIVVTGKVTDADGNPLPGVNILIKGTVTGVITDVDGNYSIEVDDPSASLVFSSIGYLTQEVEIAGREAIDVTMALDIIGLDEVIFVGYGTQKKSDITGTVASLGEEQLEMKPNLNIAQAIQGAIPGVIIQTESAGASPDEVIMIRGRNSILASNDPLIVVDGISYEGNISDINPNDVSSIEILKDASAAAIYGSRGSNGVILITTKGGVAGKMTLSYDGYYSVQKYVNLPENLDGAEFYDFKITRTPEHMSSIEEAIYLAGTWEDWYDVMLRTGKAQQHNLSISGGTENTKYYISGGLTDVKGLSLNDDYLRATNRINIETKIKPWLTIGTRTQFSYEDESGAGPSFSEAFSMNPLSHAYDDDGNILLYPWEGYFYFGNPLSELLYDDMDESLQIITNNFAIIDFPFVEGLSYRLNTGFRFRFSDSGVYKGRDTKTGLDNQGSSEAERKRYNNSVIENILSYQKEFGKHNIFATGVYSYEEDKRTYNKLEASGFPNDFLSWYGAAQAELIEPEYTYKEKILISQMLRLNYSFDSRYLITMTGRRDGYSGFGSATKFGIFPSIAAGWNIANESFFPFTDIVNQLKLRASWGLNGNQAVDAYETITRFEEYNLVDGKVSVPGYRPSVLGQDDLGWESSSTVNVGLDFGILRNRISGDINYYQTNTKDLLLNRTISPVHGISSITQNIGETQNLGLEMRLNSTNITIGKFRWSTSGNFSWNKNEILSLYGVLDEDGNEVDDLANDWFIGQPIRVNYDYEWNGVWQLDEADEAALWGSQPGFVKLRDVNGDYVLDTEDKQILSQQDPKVIWGMTNSFSYGNFSLDIFIHGVHGVTRRNSMMTDRVTADTKNNLLKKNWWTTENPTNDWVMNHIEAERMGGIDANGRFYQDASFVRVKDVSLSYNLPSNFIEKFGFNKGRFFIIGKNLFTFTEWVGLDPELDSQYSKPLQREYVFGVNLSF